MIILKSKREIEYIREAGRITANALQLMKKLAKPGITTGELDQRCEEYIRSCGGFSELQRLLRVPGNHLRQRK